MERFFENRMDRTTCLAYTSCFAHKMGNVLNLLPINNRHNNVLMHFAGGLSAVRLTESTFRGPSILGVRVVSSMTVLCMWYRAIRRHINRSVGRRIGGCLVKRCSVSGRRCHVGVSRRRMEHDVTAYLASEGLWWRWLMDLNLQLTCE